MQRNAADRSSGSHWDTKHSTNVICSKQSQHSWDVRIKKNNEICSREGKSNMAILLHYAFPFSSFQGQAQSCCNTINNLSVLGSSL